MKKGIEKKKKGTFDGRGAFEDPPCHNFVARQRPAISNHVPAWLPTQEERERAADREREPQTETDTDVDTDTDTDSGRETEIG